MDNETIKKTTTCNWWGQGNLAGSSEFLTFQYSTNESKAFGKYWDRDYDDWSIPQMALDLYDRGLNVMPLKPYNKIPVGLWRPLMTTRLPRRTLEAIIPDHNLAVITGRTSRNLFVVDFHNKTVFEKELRRFTPYNLDQWVVQTDCGFQIWLLSIEGEVYWNIDPGRGEIYSNRPKGVDIWTNKHLVVTPPSTLSDGTVYMFLRRDGELPPSLNKEQIKGIFPFLNVTVPTLIQNYRSSKGKTLQVKEWAENRPWNGRTGKSDKKTFIACCNRAIYENADNFRASEREIAELAGIHHRTARKSLHRLCDQGYLKSVKSQDITNHYALCSDKIGIGVTVMRNIHAYVNHDVWHRNGLGSSAQEVYEKLIQLGVATTKAHIVRMTGCHKKTVNKALNQLESYELLHREGFLWAAVPVDVSRLDEIARDLGIYGATERKRQKHQKERQSFACNVLMRKA